MTKPLPWGGRVALLLLLPIGLLPLFATVQRSVPQAPAHRFQDWSTRHAIYSQSGTSAALEAARSDPRALFRWREVEQRKPSSVNSAIQIPVPLPRHIAPIAFRLHAPDSINWKAGTAPEKPV